MFDKIDFNQMGKMFQEAQAQAQKMQDESEKKQFTAKSGGGLIKVTISGKGEVVDISIDDSLLEDKESLQILLISAMNDAMKMVEDDKKLSASEMISKFSGLSH